MAWLTTNWESELEQVEAKINEVLDQKVEPLTERVLAKASAEMTAVISTASFELHETANHFFAGLSLQRQEMVKDMKAVVRYTALVAFIVVVASAGIIKLLGVI